MKDTFIKMHPTVGFVYFSFVILLSAFLMNPICLLLSFVCALMNTAYLNGGKTARLCLVYILPMFILISVINPVFNHEGATIITYFSSGNPLTLESIVYGAAAAILMASVILWFSFFNTVMTSDKIVYLFGRILPSLSLVLSMTLRFVPKFSAQFKTVRNAQKCIGRDISDGSLLRRIKNAVKIVSVMITWSLENAIETADSMKSRGYGLKGRTSYSVYRFDKRDLITLILTLVPGFGIVISAISGAISFSYFPYLKGDLFTPLTVITYIAYAVLMLLPLIINAKEDISWKRLRSTI
ncbi:MAG: energy-coupling factor transporter transmembrane protein EcfT [Clostridiales bacterium]|nr:energy-coupling factor transporter transmembrane protein EcfT [Clostridiales bacterium]